MDLIVELLLRHMRTQLTEQRLELAVPQNAQRFLIKKGFDALIGARPLHRTTQRLIEDPLAARNLIS